MVVCGRKYLKQIQSSSFKYTQQKSVYLVNNTEVQDMTAILKSKSHDLYRKITGGPSN